MYPGLSDADCRANEFRLQQIRLEAACRHYVAATQAAGANHHDDRATPVRDAVGLLIRSIARLFTTVHDSLATQG